MGYSKIVLAAACASAAAVVNCKYDGENSNVNYPSGCILYYGTVTFNSDSTGQPSTEFQPLCAGAQTATCVRFCACAHACASVRACVRGV